MGKNFEIKPVKTRKKEMIENRPAYAYTSLCSDKDKTTGITKFTKLSVK